GPVRAVIQVQHDFLKPGEQKSYPTPNNPNSYFTQDIICYNEIDRIDFVTAADWWEEHVMLKVAFDVSAQDTFATYEIPFGTIQRPTTMRTKWEKARFEVSHQQWQDLTDSSNQFGVSLLNRAKYGGDIHDSVMRLSLLRSPKWPDPMADMGKHQIEYALYPHQKSWKEGRTMQKGYEYNYPLIARIVASHKAKLPKANSLVTIEPENIILHTIKKIEPEFSFLPATAPHENAWILRVFEAYGKATDVEIALPQTIKQARLSNILEEDGEPLAIQGNRVTFKLEAHRIATIKVWF
ncbi:glycosyl hydrolase-related protein, partial [candidate division KSB1 bacterium]|nr:glycosyl hydrolase-related protein [candidate division KSB1 bacterium]